MRIRGAWRSVAAVMLCLGGLAVLNAHAGVADTDFSGLPIYSKEAVSVKDDWLVTKVEAKTAVFRTENHGEIVLSNGLISRTFRLTPNGATVGLDNLVNGEALLRGVKPEACVTLNGVEFKVGGLKGQPNYAYLTPEWIDALENDPDTFSLTSVEIGDTKERFPWKRKRYCADLPWPPPGKSLALTFKGDADLLERVFGRQSSDSGKGRELLLGDDFEKIDVAWTLHVSTALDQSTFEKEGRPGHIRTGSNTYTFVERSLPKGVRLLECLVEPLTDDSASWGPGMVVQWAKQSIKFNLRPGQGNFGIWDGQEKLLGKAEQGKSYRLRMRQNGATALFEAAQAGGVWQEIYRKSFDADPGDPQSIRLGKTGREGDEGDYENAGSLIVCNVGQFRAYGPRTGAEGEKKSAGSGGVSVTVHYEMYDGLPALSKWITIRNESGAEVMLDTFTSEMLAAVEMSSTVQGDLGPYGHPNIDVISDYMFGGMDLASAGQTAHWVNDPQYDTQVNYARQSRVLLECRPPIGPGVALAPGESFETFRTFELIPDTTERERKGLAMRRLFRAIAPWATENPLMMHVRSAEPEAVRAGIDQCAEVGFEMIILTFGSGFNIENEDPAYLASLKELADYAHSKGIEIGGYSLLASRTIDAENDVINPQTGKPGGFAMFGNSPCLESEWGRAYFRVLYAFFEKTGFDLLEHDGNYPGDVCASTSHPGHVGLQDSQYRQWKKITDFYMWCRGRGIYLNVPDNYYLNGANKDGMGYRETNWSLPRAQQIIHTRQNIYDGTWEKTPSMGWMFVPLTQYHGGGAAATIEPLAEHLDVYEALLASLLGTGVQACYRGPRLYDTDETKAVVKKWVDFYKKYRDILDSDIIHVRRADGRDIDCMMSVNPFLKRRGLALVSNPLNKEVTRTLRLPLYYTGLTKTASVSEQEGKARRYELARDYSIEVPVTIPAQSRTWLLIEE